MSFDRSKIVFDRSSEKMTNLLDSIDTQLLVDRSNVPFRSIEQRLSTIEPSRLFGENFLIIFNRSRHTFDRLKTMNFEFF